MGGWMVKLRPGKLDWARSKDGPRGGRILLIPL